MTNNDWKLTKLSGVSQIYVGIESFIEHIRNHMGKKFSNDDIWFSLDRCLEYNIKCGILLIVGYVTETEKDHYENLKIVEKLEKYKSIVSVSVGTTLGILKNTPLYNNAQKLGISLGSHENNWVNENSNFHERVKRQSDLKDKLKELGIELSNEAQQNWMI
jgi:radical SAM superfamily enzyme YgiQ (UPF0313 family)